MSWWNSRVSLYSKQSRCSSFSNTVNRLATKVVTKRIAEGVSADLKPFAFVSCLDASRSWHGTCVQCIQRLPETGQDLVSTSTSTTRTHIETTSPIHTPIPHERQKRRRRTLTEFSPHTSNSCSPIVLQDKETFQSIYTAEYVRVQTDSEHQ